MSARTMQRACVNGADLAYEVLGSGAILVVFIHGGVVADAFLPLLDEPALAARYRLIHYHRRGYGQSQRAAGPVSITQQAEDCLALMRLLGVERAHVVGYSFGGAIALEIARIAGDRVHSLALLEPTLPGAVTDPADLQYFMGAVSKAIELHGAGDPAGAIDAYSRRAFGPGYRAALDRALPGAFEQAVRDADTFLQVDLPALQPWSFTREHAAGIEQPVLSVYHVDSTWGGFRAAHDLLLSWFPQAETLVLPVDTHLLMMVDPRGAAEGLAAFFARHPLEAHGDRGGAL